jgi:predicted ABC-type ATPase
MANFVYYAFFIFLNLFLFLSLSKKSLLNRSVNLIIATIFIVIYITHQLNYFIHQINPSDFRKICAFSITLIFWFYLNNYILKKMETKISSVNFFNKCISIFMQKGFLIYLFFIMTTVTQLNCVSRIH